MNLKIRSAERKLRKWTRLAGKEKRNFEKQLGKNNRQYRKKIEELNKRSKIQDEVIRRKHSKKIEHYTTKYNVQIKDREGIGKTNNSTRNRENQAKSLPSEIGEYKSINVFNITKTDEPKLYVECCSNQIMSYSLTPLSVCSDVTNEVNKNSDLVTGSECPPNWSSKSEKNDTHDDYTSPQQNGDINERTEIGNISCPPI